jgi:hypothetical protein
MVAVFRAHCAHGAPTRDPYHARMASNSDTQTDNIDADGVETTANDPVHEPRLWIDNGWTARVMKNEDDDGWAVAMTRDGEREPALIGPWTMGRDKKNPKPLDTNAFNTLVKTAAEVIRRHEQALHAAMHKQFQIATDTGRVLVTLDIVPDEFDPHALLAAQDEFGEQIAQVKVRPDFKLTMASAGAWVDNEYRKPS